MKLRIRGNTLRFRLGRSEVKTFGQTGTIEEKLKLGPPSPIAFSYAIEKTPGNEFSGSFVDGKLTVRIPEKVVNDWVKSEEVSIEGSQKLDETTDLSILIEKDFVCLNAHNDEDQSDRYPHPKGNEAC